MVRRKKVLAYLESFELGPERLVLFEKVISLLLAVQDLGLELLDLGVVRLVLVLRLLEVTLRGLDADFQAGDLFLHLVQLLAHVVQLVLNGLDLNGKIKYQVLDYILTKHVRLAFFEDNRNLNKKNVS